MWNGIDKRAFPRANYPCLVRVTCDIFSQTFETHTENIGVGGICVVLDRQLSRFNDVDIALIIDKKEEPIRCGAQVVWVVKRHSYLKDRPNYFDTGIEFVDMNSGDKARISVFIDKLREQELENA